MQIFADYDSLDALLPDITTRPGGDMTNALEAARPILDAVRERGDEAVREFTARFDGAELDAFEVEGDAFASASAQLNDDLIEAITVAHRNITTFHEAQNEAPGRIETTKGVTCWRRSVPIERVGLYVPGGTAPLFSSVLMLAVPATIAGCEEIVLCTPPSEDGRVHPAILYAAELAGVDRVLRIGGAQAVAAVAYGTEQVPKVDKILGPGNRYVTAAKQLVSAEGVAIDMPAGPTEVAIICDTDADARFVAADVLSQAEHGPDSDVLVIVIAPPAGPDYSPDSGCGPDSGRGPDYGPGPDSGSGPGPDSASYAERVQKAVDEQLAALPRADIARRALEHSRIVVVPDAGAALTVSDAYAPEHLIIQAHRAEWIAEQVRQAGSVFIGPWTPESLGDYASGTNHTLPTAGAARAYAGVSLDSFVRKITFQTATPDGLAALGPHVATMARAEELDGHAAAIEQRLAALARRANNLKSTTVRAPRTGFIRRSTNETDIIVHIDLDGSGRGDCRTGLGFFDHMLDQIARHSGIDLSVICDGDLEVDEHHTIEDTAIALGEALRRALGDKKGIERYGFTAPMDEAQARVVLDLSGRAWLEWDVDFDREHIGDVPTEMFRHFFHSFSDAAACTLHVSADGKNEHHVIEAVFKGFARALGRAVSIGSDPDRLPSTKGAL